MSDDFQNLLDLVVPSTTADTEIHIFEEFKNWINFSFTPQTDLNPPSHITKKNEMRVRKGKSVIMQNQERSSNTITTSLNKKFSIAYNGMNQIEERGQNLEHSALADNKSNGKMRKPSFELGFELKQNSVRSHSAQSSVSANGFEQINQYELVKLLGRGAFADVYLAIDVDNKQRKEYAVKILCSKKIKKRLHMRKNSMMLQGPPSPPPDLEQENHFQISLEKTKTDKTSKKPKHSLADLFVRNEVAILKKMNHKYITKLYDVIVDNENQKVYLVLQYCSGGFIGEHKDKDNELQRKTAYKKLLQSQCKRYTKQLASALDYIHNVAKIAHRDIKPENILLSQFDEVKISDFGLGTHKIKGKKYAGTPLYMPPEAQQQEEKKGHLEEQGQGDAKAGDIWALGVTLLVLFSGRTPDFKSNKIDVQYALSTIRKDVSESCQNFIKRCLQPQVSKRIKAEELIGHKWLGGEVVKHNTEGQVILVTLSEQQDVISLRKEKEDAIDKKKEKKEGQKLFGSFEGGIRQSNTTKLAPASMSFTYNNI